ncbi:hypothetical protein AB0I54_35280 [Streptomyces sp. NPDC050625]|uniref:zinc ribbon domain-containing protein n=1 Tax=Streptomyces sp. NPDC050625 TaxID=3154629 RepID=UPI003424D2C5
MPKQAYRHDTLSAGYRLNRVRLTEAFATAAAARDDRARRTAERIVARHGANLTVEDCDIRTWYRLWGKTLQATTPGRLITAIGRECEKTGGRMLRASTFTTKLSQTCFCGTKVAKTLADRIHACTSCGFIGDRDKVSAALNAHVRLNDPDDPSTARLDIVQARHTQVLFEPALQEALSSQPQRGARPARGRTHAAAPTSGHPDHGPLLDTTHRPVPDKPRMRPDPRTSGTRPTSEQPATRTTRHPGASAPHRHRTDITALRDYS